MSLNYHPQLGKSNFEPPEENLAGMIYLFESCFLCFFFFWNNGENFLTSVFDLLIDKDHVKCYIMYEFQQN